MPHGVGAYVFSAKSKVSAECRDKRAFGVLAVMPLFFIVTSLLWTTCKLFFLEKNNIHLHAKRDGEIDQRQAASVGR